MPRLERIEKSGFRHGEYVGYGGGVWRIVRDGRLGWRATHNAEGTVMRADTLTDMDRKLGERR